MAIDTSGIWAPRPEAAGPRHDVVGTFRTGTVVKRRPVSLDYFRVTTDDVDVAEALEELLGGDTSENDSDREGLQVMTSASAVDVILESVDSQFSVWSNGKLVRTCNGAIQTSGDDTGRPCPCAGMTLEQRKEFSNAGGCKPAISILFRLEKAPDLGSFRFRSSAWTLMQPIQAVEAKVDEARDNDAPKLRGRIEIEQVTSTSGRTFKLPRVTVRRG